MRFEEANEKGIHGRKIKFIVEDHQYQVPRAVQAANKLINNDKIFAMVGALGTPMNNAVLGEQLQKGRAQHVPVHGGALDGGAVPQAEVRGSSRPTTTRCAPSTKHFVEKEGKKKVCVMYQDTDFGHEIRDGVRDQAKAMKLEVAAEASYGPADTEFVAPDHQAQVGGLRPRRHGLDHPRQHPVRRHGQEARLDGRDVRRPGRLLRSDRGGGARRHHGRLLLRHRPALRLCGQQRRSRSRRGRPSTRPGPARTPTAPRSTAMSAPTSSSRRWRRPART